MAWWFVIAAILLIVVGLWRLDGRVKRREGYTTEHHRTGPYDGFGSGGG